MSLESEIRKIITPKIINENKDCDICGDGVPCTCGESQEQIGESKPESLDKTLEDLFQEGQIGEFDHLEEGYEAEVKKVLDKKGIDAYFKNGMLMISKKDMNDAVKILKKQDFDMPKVKAEDVSAYTKDIQQHPKLKAAHSDKMQKIKEEEEMQEDNRFGLSQSLVDTVAKIIGGERPEAVSPAQQAAIAIAKKKKGEKPKDEDASNDKSDDGDGLDKVDPKAAKKKFADRKDKDIDNDGDVDSSDKFLHKKRKAIGKAIAKDKEKDEGNAFGRAVTAAKEAGKKEFVFAGKTFQVKELHKVNGDEKKDEKKKVKELHKVNGDEKKDEKKNGKKEPVDTNPKMAEEVEVEEGMLKVSDFDGKKHAERAGLKVKMGASSPFGGASATLSGPDDKLIKYAVQHLGGSGKTLKDVQKSLNEAKMTDAQMKKREEIVMSLKKRMPEFEDKYGDKAKDVMFATATKIAMKSA